MVTELRTVYRRVHPKNVGVHGYISAYMQVISAILTEQRGAASEWKVPERILGVASNPEERYSRCGQKCKISDVGGFAGRVERYA